MDKFLENFFKIHRLRDWQNHHTGQWLQFSDLLGNGDVESSKLNEKQRKWVKYLERDVPGDDKSPFKRSKSSAGLPEIKEYPKDTDLDDPKEWEKMYQLCQDTWYQMLHNPEYAGYDMKVKQFISTYAYLFSDTSNDVKTAPGDIEDAINDVIKLLEAVPDKNKLRAIGISDFNKLQDDVTKKKYNTDKKSRETIQQIASKLITPPESFKDELDKAAKNISGKSLKDYVSTKGIGYIPYDENWLAPDYSAKIGIFQNNFSDFLKDIYDEPKVFDAFKANEPAPNSITKAIDKAKNDVDYDNKESANFIHEKAEENLTCVEQIQKWAGEKYEDYLKKYEGFSGGKKVGHPDKISTMMKIIDKEGIKPTDGLEKIIEKSDDLYKKMQFKDKQAAEGFKWFTDALKDFNTNPNMASTMKGTLKSGAKMRELVAHLIMRATQSGKTEDVRYAEMAMDLMTVIQYGHSTSAALDVLKKDKDLFNIFSNKELSWNKNEGIQFVTNAMDKTLKTAFFLFGRGAAFAYNKYTMRNKKFTDENLSPELRQASANYLSEYATDKKAAEDARNADIAGTSEDSKKHNIAKTNQIGAIAYLKGKGYVGADEDIIKAAEADIYTYRSDERLQQSDVNQYTEILEQLEKAQSIYEELKEPNAKRTAILADKTMTDVEKFAKLAPLESDIAELEKQLVKIGDKGKLDLNIVGLGTVNIADTKKYKTIDIEKLVKKVKADTTYQKAQKKLEKTQNKIYERQSSIDAYNEAIEDIKRTEELMKEREKIVKDWDKNHTDIALHLEQYWNALQAPGMTTMRLFSKRVEDGNKLISDKIARMGTGLSY